MSNTLEIYVNDSRYEVEVNQLLQGWKPSNSGKIETIEIKTSKEFIDESNDKKYKVDKQLINVPANGKFQIIIDGSVSHYDVTGPEAPIDVALTVDESGHVTLSWTNPEDDDIERVNIYLNQQGDIDHTPLPLPLPNNRDFNEGDFGTHGGMHRLAGAGNTYTFKDYKEPSAGVLFIQLVDYDGNEGKVVQTRFPDRHIRLLTEREENSTRTFTFKAEGDPIRMATAAQLRDGVELQVPKSSTEEGYVVYVIAPDEYSNETHFKKINKSFVLPYDTTYKIDNTYEDYPNRTLNLSFPDGCDEGTNVICNGITKQITSSNVSFEIVPDKNTGIFTANVEISSSALYEGTEFVVNVNEEKKEHPVNLKKKPIKLTINIHPDDADGNCIISVGGIPQTYNLADAKSFTFDVAATDNNSFPDVGVQVRDSTKYTDFTQTYKQNSDSTIDIELTEKPIQG